MPLPGVTVDGTVVFVLVLFEGVVVTFTAGMVVLDDPVVVLEELLDEVVLVEFTAVEVLVEVVLLPVDELVVLLPVEVLVVVLEALEALEVALVELVVLEIGTTTGVARHCL